MMTKLLVTNLPSNINSSDLEDMFTLVGDVRVSSVEKDPLTGLCNGTGRVEMSTVEQAQDVILRFNGHNAMGHILAVREDRRHIAIGKRTPLQKNGTLIAKKRKK